MTAIIGITAFLIRTGATVFDLAHDVLGWGLLFTSLAVLLGHLIETPGHEWFKSSGEDEFIVTDELGNPVKRLKVQ